MPLTDTKLRSLKATGKAQKIFDSGGLFIFLTAKGKLLWRMAYYIDGKQKTYSIGAYPAVTLAQARAARDEAKKLLNEGKDPVQTRKEAKKISSEQEEKKQLTFENVSREWYEKKTTELVPRYRKLVLARLNKNLIPYIGKIPMTDLKPADILKALRIVEGHGHVETAHRLCNIASQVCRYAKICGYCLYNVAEDLSGALSRPASKHHAAILEPQAIGRLLADIDDYQGDLSVRYALKILPYIFVRSGELRGGCWEEIDFKKAVWIIPAERMKRRKAHAIPLSRQVLENLTQLYEYTGPDGFMFPSPEKNKNAITDEALLKAIRNMGYSKDEMTIHGFRTIATTCLNELGFHSDVIELQMSHSEKNAVRAAYNRAEHWDERVDMMQKWADYLDSLKSEAS